MVTSAVMNGPTVDVTFEVYRDLIQHIELRFRPEPGLAWSVLGANTSLVHQIESWLKNYCRGEQPALELPLHLAPLPDFTRRVLESLQEIPYGHTSSYLEIAHHVGQPRAARAVGGACGRNPFPLVIPCHRVLAADKSIGGFSCGLPIKKCLLSFESKLA